MNKSDIKTIPAYIKNAPKESQLIMKELRELITKTVPNATEKIAWNVPIYDLNGILAGFDTTKNYVSFGIDCLDKADRNELQEKGYKTGSSTVQIRFDQKIPKTIFKKLLKRQEKSNKAKKIALKKSEVIRGYTIKYHANGKTIWSKGKMKDGHPDGYWEWYRPDGTLKRSGNFKEGISVGEWVTYDTKGKKYKVTQK